MAAMGIESPATFSVGGRMCSAMQDDEGMPTATSRDCPAIDHRAVVFSVAETVAAMIGADFPWRAREERVKTVTDGRPEEVVHDVSSDGMAGMGEFGSVFHGLRCRSNRTTMRHDSSRHTGQRTFRISSVDSAIGIAL